MNKNAPLLLSKTDFEIIMSNIKYYSGIHKFSSADTHALIAELKKAEIVEAQQLPADVVRLNSMVKVENEEAGKEFELVLVTPEKADILSGKISIMSPLGIALIGYRQGSVISWVVPKGRKKFRIVRVTNHTSR